LQFHHARLVACRFSLLASCLQGQTHYGDPKDGPCETGELNISVTGATGAFCSPKCTGYLPPPIGGKCSSDLPKNTTAEAQCLLTDEDTGDHYCALVCDTDSDCPTRATCKDLGGASLCTYDDATPTPPPTPPVPTPAPGKWLQVQQVEWASGLLSAASVVGSKCSQCSGLQVQQVE
jgi:hypothetical protein